MAGAFQLEDQLKGVRKAISQLKVELKRQKTTAKIGIGPAQTSFSADGILMSRPLECVTDLSYGLSSLAQEVNAVALNQVFLNSLWFKNLRERQSNVAPSHGETFRWVLESSSPTQFERWLRSQSGIYWIMGKAGSGNQL